MDDRLGEGNAAPWGEGSTQAPVRKLRTASATSIRLEGEGIAESPSSLLGWAAKKPPRTQKGEFMQKRKVKALTLSKETLRSLDQQLSTVRGGFIPINQSTENDGMSIFLNCTSC
jgi:hypothetical protein